MHLKIPGTFGRCGWLFLGVLSIGKLGVGQQHYYLDAVARGGEDYYTNSGEAPGAWIGSSSPRLELAGEVADVDLHAVLSGMHPQTLERLVRNNQKVPGFDLTFSAPKSVSLLWALTPDPAVAAAVVAAHDAAVRAAFGWLEHNAAFVRRGRNGVEQLPATGLVGAAFLHRTSRSGDPQLHTHVLVPNLAHGADGRWSAPDARHLFWQARTAGALYRSELRERLTRALGVRWTAADERGFHEIEGITDAQRREFSCRRQDIETALDQHGIGGAAAARVATLATRPDKTATFTTEALHQRWAERAALVDLTPEQLRDIVGRDTQGPATGTAPSAGTLGRQLVEHDSTFDRSDVLQLLAAHATNGATIAELEQRATEFIADDETVVAVVATPRGHRYSTQEHLALEQHVLDLATAGTAAGIAVVAADDAKAAVCGDVLSGEQKRMVHHLLTSGNAVDVVVGVAGSGKTTALAYAQDAWAQAGVPVVGSALSARAAAELQAGSGIRSATLAGLLTVVDDGYTRLPVGGVVVVDEAAMVGTRDIARILDIATRDRAKVVLVGDHRQLPEIEAGGAFAALAHRLNAPLLQQNRRQRSTGHRRTLRHLRDGNPGRALADIDARGDLVRADNRTALLERIIGDWAALRGDGKQTLMLAARRSVVRELNDAARIRLRDVGELGVDLAQVQGRGFSNGDRVVALKNDRHIGIRNGDRGTVTGIATSGTSHDFTISVHLDDGRDVVIPADYARAGRLDHGYATTIHKAQGSTVDHALVLADHTLAREGAYVALSRGRHTNRLYATTADLADDLAVETTHGIGRTFDLLARLRQRAQKHLALAALKTRTTRGEREAATPNGQGLSR